MVKTYSYRQSIVYVSFLIPVLLMLGVLIWGLYGFWKHGALLQYKLACTVMPIMLLSTFVGLHKPTTVKLTDTSIILHAFGLKHEYKWEDVQVLKVKSYPLVGQSLVMIDKPQVLGGRYWVKSQMVGYDELLQLLLEKAEVLAKKSER